MMPIKFIRTGAVCAAALMAMSAGARATPLDFNGTFELTALNGSGVAGGGAVAFDEETQILTYTVNATGLAEGTHLQHIHGRFDEDGIPIESVTPTLALDGANGGEVDGVISVAEGAVSYGPIILGLTEDMGSFPVTGADGVLSFSNSYDLSDSDLLNDGFEVSDLFDLFLREIVIHGGIVPGDIASDAGLFRA